MKLKYLSILLIAMVILPAYQNVTDEATNNPSAWAESEINTAIEENLAPNYLQCNYTQPATRAEFCALAITLYETVKSIEITERKTFDDTIDTNVEKAAAVGIVLGTGNNNFSPDEKLTREQGATMLSRLADFLDSPLPKHEVTFTDKNYISSWALESVGQVQALGIMKGTGSNLFSPKDQYTREQSIITMLRLCDAINGFLIKVGVNYELSGAVADYGSRIVKGLNMAIKEINDGGGVNGKMIKLITADNKSDSAEAASIATRLMSQDKVVACLGPATSGNFRETISSAQAHGVPVISATATADGLTFDANGNVYDYAFRVCFSDSFQGVTLANFAINNLKAQKTAIYKDTSSNYAKGLAESFRKTFEKLGGFIVAEEGFVSRETDFRAVLTGLKEKGFDVLFVPGYYDEAGLIIAQARELGIMVPILGADGFDSPTLRELAGDVALSNVYFSSHYSLLDKEPMVLDFIIKWGAANNGEYPNAFHALGYDHGKFIGDAIKRAGSDDRKAIRDALALTQNFVGVTGTFSVGPDHNPVKSVVIIELENGLEVSAVKIAP